MLLFIPLYKGFRENLDELLGIFSNCEIKVIETYLVKTIEIMDEKTNSISKN